MVGGDSASSRDLNIVLLHCDRANLTTPPSISPLLVWAAQPCSCWQYHWSRRCPWNNVPGVVLPSPEPLWAHRPRKTSIISIFCFSTALSPPWWRTAWTCSSRGGRNCRISGTSSSTWDSNLIIKSPHWTRLTCTLLFARSGLCRPPGWGWTVWRPGGCSGPPCTGGCRWSSWSRSWGGNRTRECPRLGEQWDYRGLSWSEDTRALTVWYDEVSSPTW